MRVVIATRRLAHPGGSETFVLTVAEALAQLGHDVVLFTHEFGAIAEEAQRRQLPVKTQQRQLPVDVDATIALDRSLAIDMAIHYPRAIRLYAMHTSLEEWLPPPEPGIVFATLAPNARFEAIARGCVGAGAVIRMRQPIDIARFSPRAWAGEKPRNVLLIGNYSGTEGQRISRLKEAWGAFDLQWRQLGMPSPTVNPAEAMAHADIVVGYGRSIIEAMACGRPAYVHEHSGSDGWVTHETYERLEADGFAGTAGRPHPELSTLKSDFAIYSPGLGRVGQDLVRIHHDARLVVAGIVQAITELSPASPPDRVGLYGLQRLADSHMRAEAKAEGYRAEAKATMALLKAASEAGRNVGLARRIERRLRKFRKKLTGTRVS